MSRVLRARGSGVPYEYGTNNGTVRNEYFHEKLLYAVVNASPARVGGRRRADRRRRSSRCSDYPDRQWAYGFPVNRNGIDGLFDRPHDAPQEQVPAMVRAGYLL